MNFFRLFLLTVFTLGCTAGCASFVGPDCEGICFNPQAARYSNQMAIQNMNQTMNSVRSTPYPEVRVK